MLSVSDRVPAPPDGLSFLTHPGRILQIAREVFSSNQTSRGAMAIRRFVVRKRESRAFARPPKMHVRGTARTPPAGASG